MRHTDFSGRVVWITGASSGIGEALAVAFAAAGARIILSGRRTAELERVAGSCNGLAPFVLPLDLTRPQEFATAVLQVQRHFGQLDVLIQNAGVGQRALAQETQPAVERAIMEVNYFGPVGLSKAALPLLLAQPGASLVVVSSLMGYLGTPMRSTYAASKHALHGWFDSLREEVRHSGLHVCLVCPGYVRTHISEHALAANGAIQAHVDRERTRGIAPAVCAEAILQAVARRRDEIFVGGKEIWAVRLKRFAPRLWAWVLRRAIARGRFGACPALPPPPP